MTKKYFIAMAKLFRARIEAERACGEQVGIDAVCQCVQDFCALAMAENTLFDRKRFLTACGM